MQPQTPYKPIKRKEALISFSRDHHYGLLLVWKIKEGFRVNIATERIADYILFFYENDLQNHFEAEEAMLFPKLESDDPMLQRAKEDHATIRSLIENIRSDKQNLNLLKELSIVLEQHIRFEERTLFNYLQGKLSDAELIELVAMERTKIGDISDRWGDKFWLSKKIKL